MFPVHTTPEKFKNLAIISHFGSVFEEKNVQGNQMIIVMSAFTKSYVFKMFSIRLR